MDSGGKEDQEFNDCLGYKQVQGQAKLNGILINSKKYFPLQKERGHTQEWHCYSILLISKVNP